MTSPLFNRRDFNASVLALCGAGLGAAAGGAQATQPGQAQPGHSANPAHPATPPTRTPAARAGHKILVLGDSLSAEYGLPRGSGWVALLQKQLDQSHAGSTIVNASISGETTSGGRSRLPALLQQHRPTHVIVELGGNDALRGLSLTMTRENLSFLVKTSQSAAAKVLLLGMQMPPNYGPELTQQFAALYPAIAKATGAALVPFFLRGVGDDADPSRWFQPDRIHPNEAAQPRLLANVWPHLRPLLS